MQKIKHDVSYFMKPNVYSIGLGVLLKRLRTTHQKTIESVAYKSGISEKRIIALENGVVEMTVMELHLLADGIGVRPYDLIGYFDVDK